MFGGGKSIPPPLSGYISPHLPDGSGGTESVDDFPMSLVVGDIEGCIAFLVAGVDIGTAIQEDFHDGGLASSGS